ncbi:hypothetical protein DF40_009130 [Stenotrophomonas maltophilia M30]|nr:hypothetical protein DF40_009130 [Stenotrophomonas maltophilia M30]
MQRGLAVHVAQIGVGADFNKFRDGLGVTRVMQRCALVDFTGVGIQSGVDQCGDNTRLVKIFINNAVQSSALSYPTALMNIAPRSNNIPNIF